MSTLLNELKGAFLEVVPYAVAYNQDGERWVNVYHGEVIVHIGDADEAMTEEQYNELLPYCRYVGNDDGESLPNPDFIKEKMDFLWE